MQKTVAEINEKIKKGEAVVLTAEEVSQMAETASPAEIAKKVDVVTTATFGAMCSSGAFINFGHADPPIRMEEIKLNNVPAYGGLAAVDTYIGATAESETDPTYGGAHVIEDLLKGRDVVLEARAKGTDCYPRKTIQTTININNINEFYLYNPRNAYQNYPAATNSTSKILYTYMGNLLPKFGNITYSTAGELSPLLNDPELRTIGIGTRIFLCGAEGYVTWNGTQFNRSKPRNVYGIPLGNAATIAVTGDLKQMSAEFLKAAYFEKYGISIFIGLGIPIPVLDEDLAKRVSIKNCEIDTVICDYGQPDHPVLARVHYAQLQSGHVLLNGKKVRTAPMASLYKARQIADILKNKIETGRFLLTEPVQLFPENTTTKPLNMREEAS
ncbi:MAG: homocysteine biosynthesis protein [Candidatus Marinimicrobia bacterium]|nr:homocysteine biosynthesis protein [Candidatus Neomarinimicrobiota bacterium]